MKTCTKCGETKPLDAFTKSRDSRDGRYTYCKPCKAEWLRNHRRENPEYWRAYGRKRYEQNAEAIRAQRRVQYQADPAGARKALAARIRKDFGLTIEEYDALIAQPCGLCDATENIVLDHCHETNRVRGPLCQTCNKALGMLGEDPVRLRAAADYIEEQGAKWQHRKARPSSRTQTAPSR